MSFADDINRFVLKLDAAMDGLVPAVAQAVHQSIVEGSPVTGAPGQPVGQYGPGYHPGEVGGNLKGSWQVTFPAQDVAEISTNVVYARPIEDGIGPHGPLTLRSTVGGFHSVAHTLAARQQLVEHAAKSLGGSP